MPKSWNHLISVLLVDDDPTVLELTKIFLERSGDLSIETGESVEQAIGMLEENRYDVVVSDYQMLGRDGIDFLKYIRKKDTQIPFILFTGRGREDIVIEAFAHGADFYIRKGGSPEPQFAELERGIRESVRRRRAEQEQKKTASALLIKEAAFRSSLSPIVFSDFDGRVTYVNPAFLSLWEYPTEADVLGRGVPEFLDAGERSDSIVTTLSREGSWKGELKARRRDGTCFDIRTAANAIVDESGKSVGLMMSFIDISREKETRRQIESYLRDLEFLSQKAVEMADFPQGEDFYTFIADCLVRFVPEDAIVFVNSVEQSRLAVVTRAVRGAEPAISAIGQLLNRPLQGMVFPADIESMAGMSSGELVELTGGVDQLTFGILPEGLSRELQSLPVVGKIFGIGFAWKGRVNGNAIFVLPPGRQVRHPEILTVFVRNAAAVLQRRQAEAARKESDTIARALIDASPDSSILIDREGTILCANEIAAAKIGISIESLIGSNAFDAIPGEPASPYREWVHVALESGKPVHVKDIYEHNVVDHYIYPIRNRQGEITRIAISAREVRKT